MPHRIALALAAGLALAACDRPAQTSANAAPSTPAAPATTEAPTATAADAVVNALYRDHFAHEQNFDETYRRQRALFAPELAKRLDDDLAASAANHDEIVGLDFDPLTYAQDTMTGFDVAPAAREGDAALVTVTLRQDTTRYPVRVQLVQRDTAWRIANIRYREGDLVSILDTLAAERAEPR